MPALDRRAFLAGAAAGLLAAGLPAEEPPARKSRGSLGIVLYSYAIRTRVERDKGFADPLRFLEFCRERGADGVQLPLGTREPDYARKLRALAEKHGMFLEGSVRTPKDRADLERFAAELRTAKEAGAVVVRTVMLSGRRYETFKTADEYHQFKEQAVRSLRLAGPALARHKVRLAVENHKDFRAAELIEVLKKVGNEQIGVCVDTGNNLALLEDPLDTVKALAPHAFSCHLKDMAVEDHPDGFLLTEVPLGDGFLDLKQIVKVLRAARPEVRFNLEMITRDPLTVPCLTDAYWATLAEVPGRDLARALALVRKQARKQRLPRISKLNEAEQLAIEDRNVRRSLAFAREKLLS